jgi:putative acetyltransferase
VVTAARVLVRPEASRDAAAVREIHALAFGRPDEAQIVEALRERARPYLGLVATGEPAEDGVVLGHVAFGPATLHGSGALFTLLALGPMAVRPARQRQGIGSALVRAGLAECRRLGHDVVVVLGHPAFYPRFGFVPARPLGLMSEWTVPDEAFMVAELRPGALRNRRGVVLYPPEFAQAAP